MKKKILLTVLLVSGVCYSTITSAQQGEGISYQAGLRSSTNAVVGKTVTMQFTLINDSTSGTVVYKETQSVTTTSLGVVNCTIGKGTATIGTWKNIAWNHSPIYINAQVDTSGGTVFVDLGTTQLQAAVYAKSANGITMFQSGTINPFQMVISHSSAYPTWGLSYNDTMDEFNFVGGGNKSVTISSWSGGIYAHNSYTSTAIKPFSSSSYGNIVADGNITTGNKVQRTGDTSNMLAIAWGTFSSTGSIVNASNNVTLAAHTTASGIYDITIAGETYDYTKYTTIISSGGAGFISWGSWTGNLRIFTYNTTGSLTDQFFTFVMFKK